MSEENSERNLAPFTVGLLAERAGDAARAAAAYAQFITQWPDAEPFPLLLDARARLARLESRRPG